MMDQPRPTVRYAFGPFELDAASRRLTRDGEPLAVPERHIDILLMLVSRPGEIVSKDALIEAAWQGVSVTDNSLEQAISGLRRVLDRSSAGPRYIETVARRGYRFAAPVSRTTPRLSSAALDAMLAPFRAFVEGRAALETLEREPVDRARRAFEEIVQASPDYARAHVGLANALALQVESTRAEAVPDRDALVKALHHAGEACRLDPSSAEAWCVLGLVCHQSRDTVRAIAAAQRATALEPDNWRHQLRLAYVSWGEDRLRAARSALRLVPGLALAHWLAATVYIARQAFAEAEHELMAGAAAQDRQVSGTKFRAVGLHLLLGLLKLSNGDGVSAVQELTCELAATERALIYTAEARASAWCALGAARLRGADHHGAVDAFARANETIPQHPVAMAALAALTGDAAAGAALVARLQQLRQDGAIIESALAEATFGALAGRPADAALAVLAALERQPAGSAGWIVPIDPLLDVRAHPDAWERVLALLRSRAA